MIEPQAQWRKKFYKLSLNPKFDNVMFFIILINTLILATDHYDKSDQYKLFDKISNYIFVFLFLIEATIKLIGFGKRYFRDGWQVFDFIIVTCSVLGLILEEFLIANVVALSALFKGLRSIRILKLFKKNKSLRVIFNTFMLTLPNLVNVGGLLLLLMFIYAIIGINLFAMVKLTEPLNEHYNFQNIPNALTLLLTVSTGEIFYETMYAYARQRGVDFECIENPSYQDYYKMGKEAPGCGNWV